MSLTGQAYKIPRHCYLCKNAEVRARRSAKKFVRKLRRLAERRDMENAPTGRIAKGWID